jgi:hypothetical protein
MNQWLMAGLGALVLAACSSAERGTTLIDRFIPGLQRSAAATSVTESHATGGADGKTLAQLDRAAIAGRTEPMLLVAFEVQGGGGGTMHPVGSNGPYVTWLGSQGYTFVFRNGVLTSTKGLGFDLMVSDAEPLLAVLPNGGTISRDFRHIEGDLKIKTVTLS